MTEDEAESCMLCGQSFGAVDRELDVICLICESVTGVWPWSKVVASAAVMNNLPYGIDASQRHFFFCA